MDITTSRDEIKSSINLTNTSVHQTSNDKHNMHSEGAIWTLRMPNKSKIFENNLHRCSSTSTEHGAAQVRLRCK